MRFELAENERKVLREIQRQEKYKRDYVKVTVFLMLDLSETPQKIAVFLGIDDGTVYRHLENYQTNGLDKFLGNNYAGYWGKLSSFQIAELKREVKKFVIFGRTPLQSRRGIRPKIFAQSGKTTSF